MSDEKKSNDSTNKEESTKDKKKLPMRPEKAGCPCEGMGSPVATPSW